MGNLHGEQIKYEDKIKILKANIFYVKYLII